MGLVLGIETLSLGEGGGSQSPRFPACGLEDLGGETVV